MLLEKRRRFLLSSFILSIFLFSIQLINDQTYKFIGIGGLCLLVILLFRWSLKEGLTTKVSYLILVLPVYYTASLSLFWFLLPKSIIASSLVVILYGISIYVLFLTTNVFSVSTIKTIALYRAAKGVGFLLTLVAFFLSLDAVLSLRLPYYYVGILVFFVTFPLYLQGLWTSTLQSTMSRKLLQFAFYLSLIQSQISIILFFWPVGVIVGSLFLTIFFYILLGLSQSELEGRLFKQTIGEYLMVGAVVFTVMFFTTSWRGY